MGLAGAAGGEVRQSKVLHGGRQAWFFFDTVDPWRRWWELDPEGEWAFPAMGRVREEYDVRGCAAICRVSKAFANVVQDGDEREAVWSGAAKPFGTVEGEDGGQGVVTGLRGFVTDAFSEVRLVPLDSVGGRDLSTADPGWMEHVMHHLGVYLDRGPRFLPDCWYCGQLVVWENAELRSLGVRWLQYNSSTCIRPAGGSGGRGGSAHGH